MLSQQFWAFPIVTAKCKETQESLWQCPANHSCGADCLGSFVLQDLKFEKLLPYNGNKISTAAELVL